MLSINKKRSLSTQKGQLPILMVERWEKISLFALPGSPYCQCYKKPNQNKKTPIFRKTVEEAASFYDQKEEHWVCLGLVGLFLNLELYFSHMLRNYFFFFFSY